MKLNPPACSPASGHRYALRVYYEDTDAGGVVYHANYLRFAERARTEALRDAGVAHSDMVALHGLMFLVRRVKVDYHAPAKLDESLVVVTTPLAIRGAVIELRQSVEAAEGRVLAVLELFLACVRVADVRPARIPARWRHALVAMGSADRDGHGTVPSGTH